MLAYLRRTEQQLPVRDISVLDETGQGGFKKGTFLKSETRSGCLEVGTVFKQRQRETLAFWFAP